MTEQFEGWFPFHTNTVKYDSFEDLQSALERKEVDAIVVPNKKEYTCLANLTGRPAVTTEGVTIIGKHFDEKNLMKLVKAYGGDK
jgi:Asp-tRNA(Asn)/Glu-tRNA(Gln) amidotransferase A subunit family amidase